jgi:PEGA domain
MKMGLAKFQPVAPANTVATGGAEDVASLSTKLQPGSDPPGAEIDVDGSFVGNTPSDVQIAEGEHTVAVKYGGVQRLGAQAEGYGREQRSSQRGARETSKSVATHGDQSASLCSAGQPRRLSPHERFRDNAKWERQKTGAP